MPTKQNQFQIVQSLSAQFVCYETSASPSRVSWGDPSTATLQHAGAMLVLYSVHEGALWGNAVECFEKREFGEFSQGPLLW